MVSNPLLSLRGEIGATSLVLDLGSDPLLILETPWRMRSFGLNQVESAM